MHVVRQNKNLFLPNTLVLDYCFQKVRPQRGQRRVEETDRRRNL